MPTLLRMPEVAAAMTSALLSEWLVVEGDHFVAGEALAVVETDKAQIEITADVAGALVSKLADAGREVAVGEPIAVLSAPGETVTNLDDALDALGLPLRGHASPGLDEPGGNAAPQTTAHEGPAGASHEAIAPRTRLFASPLARRIAADAGLDIAQVRGSGPRGRVRRADVDAAIAARSQPRPAEAPEPAAQPAPAASAAGTQIPHTRMRRAIASRLSASKRDVPHFYVKATVDATQLVALRRDLKAAGTTPVSLNDLVVAAAGRALVQVPDFNVVWGDDAVTRLADPDVAIAVATENGLLTPVIRGAGRLGLAHLAAASRDLAARAQAGRLGQAELEGGALTVTNLGMHGVEEFAAIINPPQCAILAVGAVRDGVTVVDGAPAVAPLLTVVLSVDHRPADGVLAARWLSALVGLLENPLTILL